MKKVLITGATGFIGRHCLTSLLSYDYEVHAITSKEIDRTQNHLRWHKVDILDSAAVSNLCASVKPSHLLHLAWYTKPGEYLNSTENIRWVQSSLALFQEFARNGGKRIVVAGTCFEYDWRYGLCSERLTPNIPETFYGQCKHSLQILLNGYSKQENLSTAWARIFFVYGSHEHPKRLVPSTICSLLKGDPARCTHGNQLRDYLYVKDAADAIIKLLESELQGPINIGSGAPIALKDIVHVIARKLKRENLIQFGTIPTPAHEPHLILADVERLKQELGWQQNYDLDDGIEETINYWKKHTDLEVRKKNG